LIDANSRAYRDGGLAYMSLGDDEACERLLANQMLLRLPLVRTGDRLSVGAAQQTWRAWLSDGGDQ